MNDGMDIGRVVLAKAGRDKGKHFVIVGRMDENYVLIANGKSRSIDKPKKKKIKHLEAKPHVLYNVREKILSGQKVFDAELRKSLEALGYEK
ncbi:MAG: KOW domain-containing RNA-binding protein [Caldicoprobacter sp.]|jgi:Ribosomal protein L14E/L6E/L27E|uniref:RNA-binding protein n=1 Tax=Caldicoprobacter sp. TaxID=2004500 RepID=UPI00396E458D